jgi:hypothetical protein
MINHFFVFISILLAGIIVIVQPVDAYIVLLDDDFNRANNSTVGNNWTEYEPTSKKRSEAQIQDNQLFLDSNGATIEPCVSHTFANVTENYLDWSFVYNFEYEHSNDLNYEFNFELGDNLECGSTQSGTSVIRIAQKSTDGGYWNDLLIQGSLDDATNTYININGTTNIKVLADNSTGIFDVFLSEDNLFEGYSNVTGIFYDNEIDINSIRIYTHSMKQNGWLTKNVDDISITTSDIGFCGITVVETLDFGTVKPGEISTEKTLRVTGLGTVPTITSVVASDWIEKGGSTNIVDGELTKYSDSSGNYASKDALSTSQAIEIGTIPAQNPLDLHLQVELIINDDTYAGDVEQELTFTGTCQT